MPMLQLEKLNYKYEAPKYLQQIILGTETFPDTVLSLTLYLTTEKEKNKSVLCCRYKTLLTHKPKSSFNKPLVLIFIPT